MRTVVKTIAAGAFAALLGMATQAGAVLITVAEEGGWTGVTTNANDSFSGVPASNVDGTVAAVTSTTAAWFTNGPKSSLILDFKSVMQDVPTDGTPVAFVIATVTNTNVVIDLDNSDPAVAAFPYIHTMGFAALFQISSMEGPEFTDNPTGNVTHTETFNEGNLAACLTGGSLNAANTLCDDIFDLAFTSIAPPANFFVGTDEFAFALSLVPGAGAAVGADGRIYTPEPGASSIDFVVTIQALVVPEPGTLALFAVALIGLAFAGRRNRRA